MPSHDTTFRKGIVRRVGNWRATKGRRPFLRTGTFRPRPEQGPVGQVCRERRARWLQSPRAACLVRLHIVAPEDKAAQAAQELARRLRKMVRNTDAIGLDSPKLISVSLANADTHGGECFIRRVQAVPFEYPLRFDVLNHHWRPADPIQEATGVSVVSPIPMAWEASHHSVLQLVTKRVLDIAGSLLGILMLSPIMLLASFAVKATSPGPILFKQVRVGRHGKTFTFFKFRSMRVDTDQNLHRTYVETLIRGDGQGRQSANDRAWEKLPNDPRITRVGRFLRSTSIDELPQLFNVLKGDMSLVGPRPAIDYEIEYYEPWHFYRLQVKPGITGMWQVEDRGTSSFDNMVCRDCYYVRAWSVALDVEILVKTVSVVLRRVGAG